MIYTSVVFLPTHTGGLSEEVCHPTTNAYLSRVGNNTIAILLFPPLLSIVLFALMAV
jgi:hypothetical protein